MKATDADDNAAKDDWHYNLESRSLGRSQKCMLMMKAATLCPQVQRKHTQASWQETSQGVLPRRPVSAIELVRASRGRGACLTHFDPLHIDADPVLASGGQQVTGRSEPSSDGAIVAAN